MKTGNKVSTSEGKQGYIQEISNGELSVCLLTNRQQSRNEWFSKEQITLYDDQKPIIGDYTPYGRVIGTKQIRRDIDGMIEVTCAESDKTNNVLWVEDKFSEIYDAHLKSKSSSMKQLHYVNWISSDHIEKFLAYYGIEKIDNGKYSLLFISDKEGATKKGATKKTLSVAYKDSTKENEILDVRMENDTGKIRSVYDDKNKRSFFTVFDLRMADIVEATIISEHKLTDF